MLAQPLICVDKLPCSMVPDARIFAISLKSIINLNCFFDAVFGCDIIAQAYAVGGAFISDIYVSA